MAKVNITPRGFVGKEKAVGGWRKVGDFATIAECRAAVGKAGKCVPQYAKTGKKG